MRYGRRSKFSSDQASQYLHSVKVLNHYTKILQPQIKHKKLNCKISQLLTESTFWGVPLRVRRSGQRRAMLEDVENPSPLTFLLCLSTLSSHLSSPYCFQLYMLWESVWWLFVPSSFTLKSYTPNSCNMAYTAGSLPLRLARPLLFSVLYPLNSLA